MTTPLTRLEGVGPKTVERLNAVHILCVEDLLKPEHANLSIARVQMKQLREKAQKWVSETKPLVAATSCHAVAQSVPEASSRYFDTHSWYEHAVMLPCHSGELCEAVIFELAWDTEHVSSVAFVVQLKVDAEHMVSAAYTPQLIVHYNPDLPKLEFKLNPSEERTPLQHQHLEAMLWETNCMWNSMRRPTL